MKIDENQILALLQRPSEALQVELKTWLDPRDNDHIAKLVKAIFAIRNRNGGFIVIGFDDTTQLPDKFNLDESVENLYHVDKIQGLVSRYASEPFEIAVPLRKRDEQQHPVIVVPDGVRVPVVVKRDLVGDTGKKLLQSGDVYFRTLQSNGTPSSARLLPSDYTELLDICFENREADIGRFVRRHLSGIDNHVFGNRLGVGSGNMIQQHRERAFALIQEGANYTEFAAQKCGATAEFQIVKEFFTMRVGLVLDPAQPGETPTKDFLNKVFASNPQYTNWPIWGDSRALVKKEHHPYVLDDAWQVLIVSLDKESWLQCFEFMRFNPNGKFYLQRVMQDDFKQVPSKTMDVILTIYRVAEVLAVGLSIARNIGSDSDSIANFAFRWTGLKGRILSSSANPMYFFDGDGDKSHSDMAEGFVRVPVDISHSALGPHVAEAVGPLFSLFDGYEPSQEIIETCVQLMIGRKMNTFQSVISGSRN